MTTANEGDHPRDPSHEHGCPGCQELLPSPPGECPRGATGPLARWHIEHNNSPGTVWKTEIRARPFFKEDAEREARRLNRIAEKKGVPWRYRAAPDQLEARGT